MRRSMLAITIVSLIAVPAFGASDVAFQVGLGGTNNGATCDRSVAQPAFTAGNLADGQVFQVGQLPLTWDVRLVASGTTVDGAIRGVANFVFDLELHQGTADGPLVTAAQFYSSANNAATMNCGPEENWTNYGSGSFKDACYNKTSGFLSNAAFAYYFTLNGAGPARVFDYWTNTTYSVVCPGGTFPTAFTMKAGGPRMNVHCYPKAAPATGQMLGMGAGYSSWTRANPMPSAATVGGVGMTSGGDPTYGALGAGPLCEGQISGLAAGTYVLKVIPGGGVNVLRNTLSTAGNTDVFAAAADTTQGDTITFYVQDITPVTIQSFASVRFHGTTSANREAWAITKAGAAARLVEPRKNGVAKIVVTFSGAPAAPTGPVNAVSGATTVPAISQTVVGNTLELVFGTDTAAAGMTALSSLTDRACWTIDLAGIIPYLTGDTNMNIQACQGNVDFPIIIQSNNVTGTDMNVINANKTTIRAIVRTKPWLDVNCDGVISGLDLNFVNTKKNTTNVPCP